MSAQTIKEFCSDFRMSRSKYYELRRNGLGPVEMKIGCMIRISDKAAEDWQRKCEGNDRAKQPHNYVV